MFHLRYNELASSYLYTEWQYSLIVEFLKLIISSANVHQWLLQKCDITTTLFDQFKLL